MLCDAVINRNETKGSALGLAFDHLSPRLSSSRIAP